MNIIWSDEALEQLRNILLMVAEYAGFASSDRYLSEFERIVELASQHPKMGRIGIAPRTRELFPINGKYRIIYEVQEDTLYVLGIKSTKQHHE